MAQEANCNSNTLSACPVRAELIAALEAISGLTTEGSNGEPATATVLSVRLAGAIGHARAVLARARAE